MTGHTHDGDGRRGAPTTTIRLAERTQVAHAYPAAPPEAVEHIMWALHRLVARLSGADGGSAWDAAREFIADVADYPGPEAHMRPFGPVAIAAACGSRHPLVSVRAQLSIYRLLHVPSPAETPRRWVIIGPITQARNWARDRGIGLASVVMVGETNALIKLRGMSGAGVAIVILSATLAAVPAVHDALAVMRAHGAVDVDRQWRPAWPGTADTGSTTDDDGLPQIVLRHVDAGPPGDAS